MRVAVDIHQFFSEPYLQTQHEHVLGMTLRPGSIVVGLRRSKMRRVTFQAGEMGLFPRHLERWVGTGDQERLILGVSDAALMASCDGIGSDVELRHQCRLVDSRVGGLVATVNTERIAGFPSRPLFLDSIEQALAQVMRGYAVRHRSMRTYRGGLGPARLRTIKEFVQAKMEDELTLIGMAQSVELSPAHFSRMFRDSTGETPHQFVLRHRIERAKEMLRAPEARALDVAVGMRIQNAAALCSGVPPALRCQPHGVSIPCVNAPEDNHCNIHTRRVGITELLLRVQKINQNAVNFYSGHGFRVVGEETFPLGTHDHAALVMRLDLSRTAGPKQNAALNGGARTDSEPEILRSTQEQLNTPREPSRVARWAPRLSRLQLLDASPRRCWKAGTRALLGRQLFFRTA